MRTNAYLILDNTFIYVTIFVAIHTTGVKSKKGGVV